jgi:hypothetical protein
MLGNDKIKKDKKKGCGMRRKKVPKEMVSPAGN